MSKILLAFGLLIISVLPNSNMKTSLENNIKSKIDGKPAQEEIIEMPRYSTVDYAQNFKKTSTNSKAAYFYEPKSGQVLFSKNEESKLPIASITKLMTSLITVQKADLDDEITIKNVGSRQGDSIMGLRMGDTVTVRDLLEGTLINSGSDAALALSTHVSDSTPEFVALMNEQAALLGLKNTQFTNPVGWDQSGNYSTAHDLAILSRIALTNPVIKGVVAKKSQLIITKTGRKIPLINTNLILDQNYRGTKTGTTYEAGECLASYYNDGERELVGVILNSPNRFLDTRSIINWAKANFIFSENDSN